MRRPSRRRVIVACTAFAAATLAAADSRAQTVVLEPFTLAGTVVVGDAAGLRTVSGLELVATGTTPHGQVRSSSALVLGSPARHSAQVVRVTGGQPVQYGFSGETLSVPTVRFQQDSRAYGEILPGLDAPAEGDAVLDVAFTGLCSVPMSVAGWPGQLLTGLELRAEQTEGGASHARFVAYAEAPAGTPPSEAVGYLLGVASDGAPLISGELLLRGGRDYALKGSVRVDGTDLGFFEEDPRRLDAATCEWVVDGSPPIGGEVGIIRPLVGTLTGRLALRGEAADPLAPQLLDARARLLFPSGDLHREWLAQPDGSGTASFGGPVAAGTWLLRPTARLGWADGRIETLDLPAAAAPWWTPLLPLPLATGASAPPELYPDTSVLLEDGDVATAAYDAPLGYVAGTVAVSGCLQPSELVFGEARFDGVAATNPPIFGDEDDNVRLTPAVTEGGRARTQLDVRTGRYELAAPPGPWRHSGLTLQGQPPGTDGAGAFVDVTLDEAASPYEVAAGRASAQSVAHSLAFGAVSVRLAVRNLDGSFRPFRLARASIDGAPARVADGTRIGTYRSSSSGADTTSLTHGVRLFGPPGLVTIHAAAFVPANPDGTGPESLTAFPPIADVPLRAPRADGSCAAICADTVAGVYWNDDLRGPAIALDEVPARTRAERVTLTGTLTDEAPVDSFSVAGVAVALTGAADDTTKRFTVEVPLAIGPNALLLEARDRCRGLGAETVTIERTVNAPPVFQPVEIIQLSEGETGLVVVAASDADGPAPTLALEDGPPGATFDPTTGELRWTPSFDDAGRHELVVTADDGEDVSRLVIVFEVADVNRPPVFVALDGRAVDGTGAEVAARERTLRQVVAEAMDPDGDTLTWSARARPAETLPAGLEIDPLDGRMRWTPDYDAAGEHVVELIATDGRGGEAVLAVRWVVADLNRAPIIDGPSSWRGREGERLEAPIVGEDPDGTGLAWSLVGANGPDAPTIDPVSGLLTWTPGFDRAGSWTYLVVASDGEASTRLPVELVIEDVNRPPRIVRVAGRDLEPDGHVVTAREAEPVAFGVEAVDPDGDEITYEMRLIGDESPLGGAALDPASGRFAWTPGFDDAGRHGFELTARDPAGAADEALVVIRVSDTNRSPMLTLPAAADAREDAPFELPIVASDPDGDVISYFLRPAAGFAFPQRLEAIVGDAPRLAWVPSFESAGTWGVDVVVEDGRGGSAAALLVILVADVNRAPVVAPVAPVSSVGHAGGVTLEVSDPDGDVVTCTAESLPAGSVWDDGRRRLEWPLGLAHGPASARLVCSDGRATASAEVALDTDWGELAGGCACDAGSAPGLALLLALVRLAAGRRRGRTVTTTGNA